MRASESSPASVCAYRLNSRLRIASVIVFHLLSLSHLTFVSTRNHICHSAQTTFRFAGALKLEEIVRSVSSLFSRFSSVPVRGRFSRLREVMLVLTADSATPSSVIADSFTQLTGSEVEAFLVLRLDSSVRK